MNCRGCGNSLSRIFLDLGASPIANNLVHGISLTSSDPSFPLKVMVCEICSLVQLPEIAAREELFGSDYVYYSSYSSSWLMHCRNFAEFFADKFALSENDLVIEVASNDGYLLQFFSEKGIRVLGIEPARNVANVAIQRGIPTLIDFFGTSFAKSLVIQESPRLIIANNVLAHVPDIHDFIEGFACLASTKTTIIFEFPHLLSLIQNGQFDTIYHEHYSYLSLTALNPIFEAHGLRVCDVQRLDTHGGSLRISVVQDESEVETSERVAQIIELEGKLDPRNSEVITGLQSKVNQIRSSLLAEIDKVKQEGLRIAAYGAAAKGNTLLNFVALDSSVVDYVVDLNPHKQGKYLPGSRIPIVGLDFMKENLPDVILVLPWNLADEIRELLRTHLSVNCKLLRAIPKLEYF